MTLSVGKWRRLQQSATAGGHFVIMAVDHRDNLRGYLQEAHPDRPIGYAEMRAFKLDVAQALRDAYSAALLDPQFSAAEAIVDSVLPGTAGLIVSVEQWGYSGDPLARETRVLDDWGVDKIARLGASGVKMLLYFNPDAPNAAAQEAVVRQVAADCARHEVPFFLEPIAYALQPGSPALTTPERRRMVIDAARRFSRLGIDVLKAEFPVNIADEADTAVWAAACRELTAASAVPWVLLSAGVGFDDFARQTEVACRAGCSGVMVGRALWKEALPLWGAARRAFLATTGAARLRQLAAICAELGRPWTDIVSPATVVNDWHASY